MTKEGNETQKEGFEPINIKALATRLNPKLGKFLPGFLVRKFEKILHIKELNGFFAEHCDDSPKDFLKAVNEFLNIKIEFIGEEKILSLVGKQAMFISNHPYGGPEAMVLFNYLIQHFPDLKLLTQSYLGFVKPLKACCVFNNKDMRTLLQAVNDKISLLFYPSGFCSRKLSNGEVFDYEWKGTFFKIARRNSLPIVTFYTAGQMSSRMHRWTAVRRFFNIKFTFETLFLVDEMFKCRNQTLKITVGCPIDPSCLDKAVEPSEWAARIRQYCHDLKGSPDLEFDPSKPATFILE